MSVQDCQVFSLSILDDQFRLSEDCNGPFYKSIFNSPKRILKFRLQKL